MSAVADVLAPKRAEPRAAELPTPSLPQAPVAAPRQDLLVEDVSIDGMCGVY